LLFLDTGKRGWVDLGEGIFFGKRIFFKLSDKSFVVVQPYSPYFCKHQKKSIMVKLRALDEIVDFIANQGPEKVLDFKASEDTKTRVYDLIEKEKTSTLTSEEKSELEYYKVLEHVMRLAKAKAFKLLQT
jgi:hypothetical protein